jgi:hypothetical protein
MSHSARDKQALESIEVRLAESDPGLASLFCAFSRLASGEAMPPRNRIHRIRPPATVGLNRSRSQRSFYRRLGRQQAALLLWLLISIGAIAVALAMSNRGTGECVQPLGTTCAGQAAAYVAPPP